MNSQKNVLLVDDDRLILATTSAGLRNQGYQVHEARSADQALGVLHGQTPDIALIDIRLGAVNGFELAATLRERGNTPFMFLSAYGDEQSVQEATRLGAVGYLVKPIEMARLVPALEAGMACAGNLERLRCESRQLESALDRQRGISTAIGILMERHRLTQEQALARLRDNARSNRRKLDEVGKVIVAATNALSASGA